MPPVTFASSPPTFFVDGVERPQLRSHLIEFVVEDSLFGPCGCRATFGNWGAGADGTPGFLHFDRSVLDIDRTMSLALSPGQWRATVFAGRIDALEGGFPRNQPPIVTCRAWPTLHKFRTAARTRTFSNMTDADVFQAISGENRLSARLDFLGSRPGTYEQKNLSDLDFLLQRARVRDAELWIVDGTLHVQARARRAAPTVTLAQGSGLLEFTATWGASTEGRLTRGTTPFVAAQGVVATSSERLHAGQRVRVEGVGPLLEGVYYLTGVSYRFSQADGLTCSFEAERAATLT